MPFNILKVFICRIIISAVSLFGFLSFGLIPIPFIFLRHGKRLRASSHYAQEALALLHKMESDGAEKHDSISISSTNRHPEVTSAGGPGAVPRLGNGTSPRNSKPNLDAGNVSNLTSADRSDPLEIEAIVSK
jgi:hypothetical protein